MKIELHPEADAELAAEVEYYEERQAGLGERFYREVISELEWIGEHPFLPRLRRNYQRVNLKLFPFYIAYAIEEEMIWVLAVAHSSRKPGYWRHRMQ